MQSSNANTAFFKCINFEHIYLQGAWNCLPSLCFFFTKLTDEQVWLKGTPHLLCVPFITCPQSKTPSTTLLENHLLPSLHFSQGPQEWFRCPELKRVCQQETHNYIANDICCSPTLNTSIFTHTENYMHPE